MRLLLLLLTFWVTGFSVNGQGMKKDSLLKLLHTAKEDTAKIMLLLNVQNVYSNENFDSSFYYLKEAESLAKRLNTTAYDRFINTGFAEYYYHNNDSKKSIEYAFKNMTIAKQSGDDILLARAYQNLATIYNYFGKYKSAIDFALKCLSLSEKTKDSSNFAFRYLTTSLIYYNLKQFQKSISYSKKAIEFGEKFKKTVAVMRGLNNMAGAYSAQNKTDSAIFFYKKQLDIAQKEGDIVSTSGALINLTYDYFKNGNANAVAQYTAELNKYIGEMPDNKVIAEAHVVNALNFILQKKYNLAKSELDSGVVVAYKDSSVDAIGNLYQTYTKLYYAQSKFKEAGQYLFKYDSLVSAANLEELNFYAEDLEAKYETEKKEAQIKLQQASIKQKNTLNYILISSAGGLLIISLLSYRNYRNRQKLQQQRISELETEKQLLATQSLLKGQEDERSRLAKDLHDGLGGLLSGVKLQLGAMKGNLILSEEHGHAFNNALNKLDDSISEMRRVAHNMMPEALINLGLEQALNDYCDGLSASQPFTINCEFYGLEQRMEPSIEIVVYRIVQELLNNAVKHANATIILAQVIRRENNLAITIEDNGKGFDTAQLDKMRTAGLRNIYSRVNYLHGQIDIQSVPDKGTSVHIDCLIESNE
jgi:two-component system NarL family sensor kinase